MFFFDPTYLIFMIPAFLLMGITSWYVRHAYKKWSQIRAGSNLTGYPAAQRLLSTGSLYGVQIQGTAGEMTDHYDSTNDDLKYAYQDAGGWHIETVDAQGGGNTSLRLDHQGYAHILYTFGAVVKYAYQDASGWHIESVTASGKSISLALDGSGAPHIAYLYTIATGPGIVNHSLNYGYRSSAGWNLQTLEMTTATVFPNTPSGKFLGTGTSIAVDLNGWPRITYAKGFLAT